MSAFCIFVIFFNAFLHLQCAVAPTISRTGTVKPNTVLVADKGKYYSAKINRIVKQGECQDKLEILRKTDNGLYAALNIPCSESNRNLLVQGQEAFVGTPDTSEYGLWEFCAFTMMMEPNVLIVFEGIQCKTITYTEDTIVERTYEDEYCAELGVIITKIEKKLRILASNPSITHGQLLTLEEILIEKLEELKPIHITPPLPRPSQPTAEEFDNTIQPVTMTSSKGSISDIGIYYSAKIDRLNRPGKCQDKIEILRNAANGLQATFNVACSKSNRNLLVQGQEALVGTPDTSKYGLWEFCAFTMMKKPNVLIVFEGIKCKTMTYTESTIVERNFKDKDCAEVGTIITKIENKLITLASNPSIIHGQLLTLEEILIEKLDGFIPIHVSSPLPRPSQLTAAKPDNSPKPATITSNNVKTKVENNNGGISRNNNGPKAFTSTGSMALNNDLVSRKGKDYWAKTYRLNTAEKCQDKIEILRNAKNGLYAALKVPCSESNRQIIVQGEEALVGNPESKFCAFTMMRKPNVLLVILDGQCKTIIYNTNTMVERTFEDKDCVEVVNILKEIKVNLRLLVAPTITGKLREIFYDDVVTQENILIEKINQFKTKFVSSPLACPSPPTAAEFDNNPQPVTVTSKNGMTKH